MNITIALNFLKKHDYIYYIAIINNLKAYTDNQIIKYAEILREEYERGYGNAF